MTAARERDGERERVKYDLEHSSSQMFQAKERTRVIRVNKLSSRVVAAAIFSATTTTNE